MPILIAILAISYLLGSVPFGYLLVRIFHREDVRQSGSGNIGATNVSRKSRGLGVCTLLLDALKGTAAVGVGYFLSGHMGLAVLPFRVMSLAALFAVIGHAFPVWLEFRGGKGVATALGAFAVIAPKSILIAVVIFIAVFALSRYVSAASVVAVAIFPLAGWRLHEYGQARLALIFMLLTSLLIVARHYQNIRRLLSGTENRFGAKTC